MAGDEVNLSDALLSNLLTEQCGLAQLLESAINQILQGAGLRANRRPGRYKRSESRTAYRNGCA